MPLTPIITLLLLALPGIVGAADSGFVPLVGIPYVDTTQTNVSLGDYVNSLYWASISIAAVLAVLRIIWAGIKYMLSEIVTEKGQAKKDIQGALYGLILIIGAVLLLDTINPTIKNLTGLDLTPLEGVVIEHDLAPPRIFTSDTGTLRLDTSTSTDVEEELFAAECIANEGRLVRFLAYDECQALPNDEAVINTDENFETLLTNSAGWQELIAGKSTEEIALIKQQRLEMYRQWISAYEADVSTYNIDTILEEYGASKILFVVKNPTSLTGDQSGVTDAYIAQCRMYAGSDNLVLDKDTNNYFCLQE